MVQKRRDWDTREGQEFTNEGEFFMVKNRVLDQWAPIIGAVGLAAYMLIARRYRLGSPDHPPKVFCRSVRQMAADLSTTPKTITRHLRELLEHQLIERTDMSEIHKQAIGYRPVLPVPEPPETVVIGNTVAGKPWS